MIRVTAQGQEIVERPLPEEAAVAISVGGSTHGVMMASPFDLEDFAYGFLLSDGVIKAADDIAALEVVETELGFDLQVNLTPELAENYRARRRVMAGPVGCGLCGVESLELALPELGKVDAPIYPQDLPFKAFDALSKAQKARAKSGAMHGAALVDLQGNARIVREDIGRHNALDKVIGAAARTGIFPQGAAKSALIVSSRISVDLVTKAARAGVGLLIGRASPSGLAVAFANKTGLCVVAPVFQEEYFINGADHE